MLTFSANFGPPDFAAAGRTAAGTERISAYLGTIE